MADAQDGGRILTARVRLDRSKGVTVALKGAVIRRDVAANDHHVDLGQVTAVVQKSRQHRAGVDAVLVRPGSGRQVSVGQVQDPHVGMLRDRARW
jgi:CTP synthase (UTP-ammonia lyase)